MPRAMLRERPYKSGMPFDRAAFEQGCAEFLAGVEADVALYQKALEGFLPEQQTVQVSESKGSYV